jgi:hypothetical protein
VFVAYHHNVVSTIQVWRSSFALRFPVELWSYYEKTYGLVRPADDVYAVVSSSKEQVSEFKQLFSDTEPATWPVRHYAWGTAAVFNPQHSDTFALRIMLLEIGFTHMDESTEAIYQAVIRDSPPYWMTSAIVVGFLTFVIVLKMAVS